VNFFADQSLDFLILLSLASAIVGGYRLGFLARVTSWAGLALGIAVGVVFLDDVARYFEEAEPGVALLASVAFLLAAGMLGQGLGLALGAALHASLPVGPGFRQYDRAAGGTLGAIGIISIFWLLTPALANVEGWPSEAAHDSVLLNVISDLTPEPPDTVKALRNILGDYLGPQVFSNGGEHSDVGPPPVNTEISPEVHQRIVDSTVKITGQACRKIQEGSGFVAGADLVVTNAHVVAGEDETSVERSDGRNLAATVIAFDPDRDLAVLRVPGIARAPLPIAVGQEGLVGAVYGHPGGGELRAAPAAISDRVTALGRDIYDRHATRRDVFILASRLRPGDSGGALVNRDGAVVGVAFAIAPDRSNTAYALTEKELEPVLANVASFAVDTGPCLA